MEVLSSGSRVSCQVEYWITLLRVSTCLCAKELWKVPVFVCCLTKFAMNNDNVCYLPCPCAMCYAEHISFCLWLTGVNTIRPYNIHVQAKAKLMYTKPTYRVYDGWIDMWWSSTYLFININVLRGEYCSNVLSFDNLLFRCEISMPVVRVSLRQQIYECIVHYIIIMRYSCRWW